MKKKELNNLEDLKTIPEKSSENNMSSSNVKNLSQDQEKTQGIKMGYYNTFNEWVEGELPLPEKTADGKHDYKDFINAGIEQLDPNEGKIMEEAVIVKNLLNSEENNFSEQMDEIIKNNDKFETINVLISVLCRELGIKVTNQPGVIGQAIKKVYDDYYKSMEDWKNLTKLNNGKIN